MSIEEIYHDEKKCREDILLARKIFTNTNTTREQFDRMEFVLGEIYLYCPKELEESVLSTLEEAQRRRLYFELRIWPKHIIQKGVAQA